MTTVVLDENLVMASDSRACMNDRIQQQSVDKIFHLNGHTIGIAGSYGQAMQFISFFEDMTERQRVQAGTYIPIPQQVDDNQLDNFLAIVVDPDCQVFMFEGNRLSFPMRPPVAIGSGGDYASVALHLGQNAVEAVATAITFDPFSGGEIQYIDHNEMLQPEEQEDELDLESLNKMKKSELIEIIKSTKQSLPE